MRGPSIMLGGMAALAVALAAIFATTPAPAQERDIRQGEILFCDTADQAKSIVEYGGTLGPAEAVAAVNASAGANVCGLNTMIFEVGPVVGKASNPRFSVLIREVLIHGGVMGGVGMMLPTPEKQFTVAPDPDNPMPDDGEKSSGPKRDA